MTTKRKAYVRTMAPNWWQQLGFYRFICCVKVHPFQPCGLVCY